MKSIFWVLLMFASIASAQDKYTISGEITESHNGETLIGATIQLEGTPFGVTTNEYGFYSLTAPAGQYTIIVSYLGYEALRRTISLDNNYKLNFELSEAATQLNEVVVTSSETGQEKLQSPEMGVAKLSMKTVKQIPVVLGEVDVLKSIQMLPGVTNGGEATSGFNVRGSAADQNLILLDEAIIYNTSHLLGFFSVFNGDAIKDIKLYKGNIPARFGGRTSSVLDVRQKDGNKEKFTLNGGLGLISAKIAAEGPLTRQKGSFLVAGRSTYWHYLLKDDSANFYDLNLKTNYEIDENNKLYVSAYVGRDGLKFSGSFDSDYGNISGNLRWSHLFNDKLFSNLSLIYSQYDYRLDIYDYDFDWKAAIDNYNLKYDFKYYLNNTLQLDFGVNGLYADLNPGEINPNSDSSPINPLKLDKKRTLGLDAYISAEQKIADKFTLQYGFRYSSFFQLGKQTLTNYQDDLPVVYNTTLGIYEAGTPTGETTYKRNERIKSFGNIEPRLGLSYQLNSLSAVKAGYSRTVQYIHQLSNTTSVSPLDIWAPSGKYIQPQRTDQYAIGYFKDFDQGIFSLELEAYYKTTDNRLDYIDGAELVGNETIETEILHGESRAYGVEFLLRKNQGSLTGWLAYTLSKSEQRTLGNAAGGPGINNGEWYHTIQDRTHDISLTLSFQLNKKWTFGSNFAFQTGRPVTYPNAQYAYEGLSIANYTLRNKNRLPAYHRLDISATYTPNKKPDKRWKSEWVFGIYNAYFRKNAAVISFGQDHLTGANEATRIAIYGIIPSVSYNFKF